ncbi:MAG TPA: single-stranded-DNA-specific exonuclease RecJ [Bacteroidales bacterium]|nr:single-stranded-DNA-specific exonuclease RecJ [Lentimicrobiaceae bacterium]HOI00240.1 single-stranded-DNA-specific exonuclease RecJ [Bacteroidales bacterium]
MEKRWAIKQQGDPEIIRNLSQALNINRHLSNLLAQRGIYNFEQAKDFFRPQLEHLHDPFLMKDMEEAVNRIEKAISHGEKILVYGDYDVDGTTAVALVYSFLREMYEAVGFYIPDRYSEGYGVSEKGINFAAEEGYSLIIALDCGIKAIRKVAYATERNVDFIIGDHHRPGDELPEAVAVLDPKRNDCEYPYKELSGCGVGFKLIQALASRKGIPFENLHRYLDLVAISIASDIVPITGENRILAHYGLKHINSAPRPGVEAILRYSKIVRQTAEGSQGTTTPCYFNRELNVSDLVFLIGPRINAAGRMESGNNSVRLLICETLEEAEEIGKQINDNNEERRNLDAMTTREALGMIEGDKLATFAKATIVYNPQWHKGVIGIVASRLTESYYRPTIVLTRSNGLITGSARSIKDFDIYDAIDACSDLLEHFGGHKYAAGLSLREENLTAFQEKFERIVSASITEEMLVPEIEIDAEINIGDINRKFFDILKQFAPFGPGNMAPVFCSRKVTGSEDIRIVGNNHLKMSVGSQQARGFPVDAIAFGLGNHYERIKNQEEFDICYHIELNEWNGVSRLQLNIKDIKMAGKG